MLLFWTGARGVDVDMKNEWRPISELKKIPDHENLEVYFKIWRKAKHEEKVIRAKIRDLWAGVNVLAWKPATYFDIVREVFPGVSNEEAGYLLWNHSPYPHSCDPKDIIKSLKVSKATWDAGKQPCILCGKPAEENSVDCKKCSDFMTAGAKR